MNRTTAFILPLALAAILGKPAHATEADCYAPTLSFTPPGPAFSPCSPTNPVAVGPQQYPNSATAITGSAVVGNSVANVTLSAVSGKTTYVCGFAATAAGATSAAAVNITLASVVVGSMNFAFGTPAGVGLLETPLIVPFRPCIPASAANIPIIIQLPALGSGNTLATLDAWGFQQ